MVVATGRGDAIELPRTAWDEWSLVLSEFEANGDRGRKYFAVLALRFGFGMTFKAIGAALSLSEGHCRRIVRREKSRLEKNSYRAKKSGRNRAITDGAGD